MATVEVVPMIADRLHPIERQWRDLVWLRGLGSVLLGTGAPLALCLLLDLFVNLPAVVRAVGLAAVISFAVRQVWRRLFVPLWHGIQAADVAHWLERAEPRLQERLLTCLELEQAEAPASRAGRLMQRQIRKETYTLLDDVDFSVVLPSDRAYSTFGRGLLVTALVIAPFAVWMSGYGLAWQRLSIPFGNWGWGRDFRIEVERGDRVVSRGGDAGIQVIVTPRRGGLNLPEQLTLLWRSSDDAAWDERRVAWSDVDHAYLTTLPRLNADTEYFVTGPASESPRYTIRVVDPPRLRSLTAAVDPLAYTGESSQQCELSAELQVVAGSRIRMQAVFDRAVAAVQVDWPTMNDHAPVGGPIADATETLDFSFPRKSDAASALDRNLTAVAQLTANKSGMFVIRWRSPEGFLVEEPPRRLVVLADQPPHVRLEGAAAVTVQPDERHRLQITARDDYGLSVAELHAELAPGERRVIPLPRATPGARQFEWPWTVDLKALGAKQGQAISLRVRVVDNCENPSPQERWSEAQVMVVSTSAPADETRALADQTQAAREDLKRLMADFAEQRQELREVHQKTAAAAVRQKDAEQDERLQKLQARQDELTEAFEDWKAGLPTEGSWDAIHPTAQTLRDGPLANAQAELADARQAEPRESIEAMSQALDELAAAQRALQQLDDDIRALGNLGDELGELARLANRSERLAESLEQAAKPESDADSDPVIADAAAEAEQLQRALEQLLTEQPELQEALEAFQRQQASAASDQAERLAQQQRELADAIQRSQNSAAPAADSEDQTAQFASGTQLAEQARELAKAAEAFSEQVGQSLDATPEARAAAAEVADQLQESAAAAERANFAAAVPAAESAAAELADAQRSLPANDPASRAAGAELAENLSQFQAALQQMTPSAEAQRGALAAGERQLQQAVEQLAEQAASASSREGEPPAEGEPPTPSQQAAAALESAQSSMAAAQQSLRQGEPGAAAQQGQAAADQLDQAAQALAAAAEGTGTEGALPAQAGAALANAGSSLRAGRERLQSQLPPPAGTAGQPGQTTPGAPPTNQSIPGGQSAGPRPMPGASAQSGDPATSGPPGAAPGPAESASDFRTAAEALRRAARSANGNAPSLAQQSRQQTPSSAAGGQEPNNVAAPSAPGSLAGAPVGPVPGTRRNWGRLGGVLKTDLLDGGPLATHPEYSRQIQRYFETIARRQEGSAPSPVGKETP